MSKALIVLIVGMLAVGCGKPVKELTTEDVVGTYEWKVDGNTRRVVFLDNGIAEDYKNGKKLGDVAFAAGEVKWKIVEGEIHQTYPNGIAVFRINKDGSITYIARIHTDGKREDLSKERQTTYTKIK